MFVPQVEIEETKGHEYLNGLCHRRFILGGCSSIYDLLQVKDNQIKKYL
jgi:hypothetical protein